MPSRRPLRRRKAEALFNADGLLSPDAVAFELGLGARGFGFCLGRS